jgi:CRISPR-associated endonuclease Csn1
MKKILGLDLGSNSIGWAIIEQDFENKYGTIIGMGSRVIPMDQSILGDFGKGNSVSQTSERTRYRSMRRLNQRNLLRRERLHRVLKVLNFLPEHYSKSIDFEKHYGQFKKFSEPKIAYKEIHDTKKESKRLDFIFKSSFNEMLEDFKTHQPNLLIKKNKKGNEAKVPYDWTIYYLRKKALTKKIEKEELAWILLNFNQKRGYYQLRGEEDENISIKNEFVELLKVIEIKKGEVDKKNNSKNWYTIVLNNGWEYSATFYSEPNWLNQEKEWLVIEELDEDGNIKIVKEKNKDSDGKEKRKITPLPSFEEIELLTQAEKDKIYKKIKAKTEVSITNSGKTVGSFIYETLLNTPNQKIRGKLIRTIERIFYKEELKTILLKQIELQPNLFTQDLYSACVRELYLHNENHQANLNKRDFVHLFLEDIIFYQRPLKSQKSSIGNCSLEFKKYKDNSVEKVSYLKAIPKSHPFYQEFRIWQWLFNLKIYRKSDDTDVTNEFIKDTLDIENLFEFLMSKKEVDHKDVLKHFFASKKLKPKELNSLIAQYRWNYVFDDLTNESKKYPCNETGYEIKKRLVKVENITNDFLSKEIEIQLWHIIYSIKDKNEFKSALLKFASKNNLHKESFVNSFLSIPPFKNDYGSFSEKAIKKLLSLMRIGKYWDSETIDKNTLARIHKIISGEFDENLKNRVRDKAIHLIKENDFQGLPLWLAQYIIYDRHSETSNLEQWKNTTDIKEYLENFKQHSLRNPIVEQIVTETLRVVNDIWTHYGKGQESYFNEIHIELGRDLKNSAEERKRITNKVSENENTNLRIKALLAELKENSDGKLFVDGVRPFSPMQQEALKIFEDGILNSDIEIPDEIQKISKTALPTKSELNRYKLWLEQKYRSPYTGEFIPLSKLFTDAFQIEHIIPQSRYFDDSLSNKVICEAAVNQLKDNQLGLEFIKNNYGTKVTTSLGKDVVVFTEDQYKNFIQQHYSKNKTKRNKLLLEEIPETMIERQLNDTRYISKFISALLSNIVRENNNDEGINSKNIIPGNGRITDMLKTDWGLHDVWNDLILPRFERMNDLTKTNDFTTWNDKYQKFLPTVPLELSKGFQKKRIDHRHHALDALVIACATRNHINLLNNSNAKLNSRFDLNKKLRNFKKVEYTNKSNGLRISKDIPSDFIKPWETFTQDAKLFLEKTIVSFKQNNRVINKTVNKYESYKDENGNVRLGKDGKPLKGITTQTKGENWAIRKPLHKETVSGKVLLQNVKVPNGKILTATRKVLDSSFDLKKIESITDTGIQKILINYLNAKNNNPENAFSAEGIEELNKNIHIYNNGKQHQPINKVRIFEVGSKFALGCNGNKKDKYVEAAKGTNLFFAIYADENGKRSYDTIPLNIVIERQKQGLSSVPDTNEKGHKLLFHLSPNDLVYVPPIDKLENANKLDINNLNSIELNNIYKMVSSTGNECHFIKSTISKLIKIYDSKTKIGELGSLNKLETTLFNQTYRIKEHCIKLKVDRLGNFKTK